MKDVTDDLNKIIEDSNNINFDQLGGDYEYPEVSMKQIKESYEESKEQQY